MKPKNSKNSNLIIGIGYCLVAVIILFNYLSSSRTPERIAKIAKKYSSNPQESKIDGNFDYLKKQLEEEKKLNREMRDFIKTYQNVMASGDFNKVNQRVNNSMFSLGDNLPHLKEFEISFEKPISMIPFEMEKNPFSPLRMRKGADKVLPGSFPLANTLKCDPIVPFLIGGAGSDVRVAGNIR